MLAKLQSLEKPPRPDVPPHEKFELGITTRILAKRQAEKEQCSRRSSAATWCSGASIPNSIARSNVDVNSFSQSERPSPDKESCRHQDSNGESNQNTVVDQGTLKYTTKEKTLSKLDKMREAVRRMSKESNQSKVNFSGEENLDVREGRRISQRTSDTMIDIPSTKRPTQEDIKIAIQNSSGHDSLMNIPDETSVNDRRKRSSQLEEYGKRFSKTFGEKRRRSSTSSRVTFREPEEIDLTRKDSSTQTSVDINVLIEEEKRKKIAQRI